MQHRLMMLCARCLIALLVCIAAKDRAYAADNAMLFRVFLTDGTSVVTYGEFARVAAQIVLSVPVGGSAEAPRLPSASYLGVLADAAEAADAPDDYVAALRRRPCRSTGL